MKRVKSVDGKTALGAALAGYMQMEPDQRALLRAKAADQVLTLIDPDPEKQARRRTMLFDFIEATWELDEEQQREYDRLLQTAEFKGVREMAATSLENGMREILGLQLKARFGTLTEKAKKRLESLSADRLRELSTAILTAASLKELGL